ncbi:MAG: GntR family transcriptional regulator [Phycisphaerales bacterium JB043]
MSMMSTTKTRSTDRTGLRGAARDTLRELIIDGELAAGEKLRESELSVRLKISRTPIREALAQLEQEGFVVFRENRGCTVAPMTEQEVEEVYTLLGQLEALALRDSQPKKRLERLRLLNAKLKSDDLKPEQVIEIDRQWHSELVEDCWNSCLLSMIKSLRPVGFRYDLAYLRVGGAMRESLEQHDAILHEIEQDRLDKACSLLEENWTTSIRPVIRLLRSSYLSGELSNGQGAGVRTVSTQARHFTG